MFCGVRAGESEKRFFPQPARQTGSLLLIRGIKVGIVMKLLTFSVKNTGYGPLFLVRPGQGQGVHRRAGACSGFQVTETRQALKQGGSTEKRHGPAVRACSSGTQGIGQHAAPQSARPVHNVDGRTCSQADTACSAAASAVSTQKAERQKIYGVLPS